MSGYGKRSCFWQESGTNCSGYCGSKGLFIERNDRERRCKRYPQIGFTTLSGVCKRSAESGGAGIWQSRPDNSFTMADHLDFAIRRIQNGEQISNPLTDDIRVMFYKEYKVASCIQELLKEKMQIEIDEHEIGYIALHVHAAIVDENVSQAMEIARTVRECISLVEKETGNSVDVMSLGYNRLMNHVRYMVARAIHGEKLKMNLNEYMSVKFPEPFMSAERICRQMEKSLKLPIPDIEIGYLAMHLERMLDTDINE